MGRLDAAKRVDLLLRAAAGPGRLRVVVVGDGPERGGSSARRLARPRTAASASPGRVDGEELADLYATCLAVYYAPMDEDFGLLPYEAFLSGKPVITTIDAGGPLEAVPNGQTGVVVEPSPAAVGDALQWLEATARRRPSSADVGGRSPSGDLGAG